MIRDGSFPEAAPHSPATPVTSSVSQSKTEEHGRILRLDGAPICEGRLSFGIGGSILVNIRSWFDSRIWEDSALLQYQGAQHPVQVLYYTDHLMAAALREAPQEAIDLRSVLHPSPSASVEKGGGE